MNNILIIIATIILAPIIGGLLSGVDRIITARLQGRMGPPLLQPFYDVIKLWNKETQIVNTIQVFYAAIYLVFAILSLVLFMLGKDLLLIVFVLTVASGALIMGALSTPSPYSQVGANREIVQLLTYEPILLITVLGLYMVTGSFNVSDIINFSINNETPLITVLPLIFFTLSYVLTIKMRKSPFDISASQHAHQEIVRGIFTEYSGVYLGIIEVAHWFELILVLGLVGMFWANNWIMAALLILIAFIFELLLDNLTARLTYKWMLKYTWIVCLSLAIINIGYIYFMINR